MKVNKSVLLLARDTLSGREYSAVLILSNTIDDLDEIKRIIRVTSPLSSHYPWFVKIHIARAFAGCLVQNARARNDIVDNEQFRRLLVNETLFEFSHKGTVTKIIG